MYNKPFDYEIHSVIHAHVTLKDPMFAVYYSVCGVIFYLHSFFFI